MELGKRILPTGYFVCEVECRCGFIVDQYDDGLDGAEYGDPDSGMLLTRCPQCARDLSLLGQKEVA